MNLNTFFTLANAIIGTIAIVMFYPLFRAKNMDQLNAALKTRPVLAKVTGRDGARSYLQAFVYFFISLTAYGLIVLDSDVQVDMELATISLVIVFFIMLGRVWKLRKLHDGPASEMGDH